jgi:23S rRNA (pseudouridine1915-N3)-methyltransferase
MVKDLVNMDITLICVGKLKEEYLKSASREYSKLLNDCCNFNIIEVPDEKTPDNASKKEEEAIKQKETEAILKYIKSDMYLIALAIQGIMPNTVELKKRIKGLDDADKKNIAFIIGGSLGLHSDLLKKAHLKLSFSKMTFPHQLMRIILMEQLLRILK